MKLESLPEYSSPMYTREKEGGLPSRARARSFAHLDCIHHKFEKTKLELPMTDGNFGLSFDKQPDRVKSSN